MFPGPFGLELLCFGLLEQVERAGIGERLQFIEREFGAGVVAQGALELPGNVGERAHIGIPHPLSLRVFGIACLPRASGWSGQPSTVVPRQRNGA
jgi:hypothetical protein